VTPQLPVGNFASGANIDVCGVKLETVTTFTDHHATLGHNVAPNMNRNHERLFKRTRKRDVRPAARIPLDSP